MTALNPRADGLIEQSPSAEPELELPSQTGADDADSQASWLPEPGVVGSGLSDSHVADHYLNASHQYEAAKLGMWLFLGTEFLLFGGLFCLYAVFRGNHPEMFRYGGQFLDANLGFLNTIVLILSSMTMAWAVRCAQLDQRRGLIACLLLTVLGGATFMGVKYVEYEHKFSHNLVWGIRFYEDPSSGAHGGAPTAGAALGGALPSEAEKPTAGDAQRGRELWMATCRSCHDADGRGIAGQGKDIRGSEFIASKSDKELVEFIKVGRMPFDKLNTTGIQMPPRGGNPLLKDEQLMDIAAYIRTFKAPQAQAAPAAGEGEAAAGAAPDGAVAVNAPADGNATPGEQEFYLPKSSIPLAAGGPTGLAKTWREPEAAEHRPALPDPRRDPNRPANLHLFFGIYFLMTGLHGLHVLAGMACISWLAVRAFLGHFAGGLATPVDLVGLYWHVVDIIWIFLFPLLYLIH